MRNILNKLIQFGEFEVIVFGDKVILDEAIENWPTCDFLLSFFSSGFPLQKAIDYVKLRKPYSVNDLEMQQVLMDRRLVLRILDSVGVPTPRRFVRQTKEDIPALPSELLLRIRETLNVDLSPETFPCVSVNLVDPDTVQCGSSLLKKPFVEKPVSGEDHNIHIYYSTAQGAGVRKLFRKVGNKSSEFVPEVASIRTDGSYIYEEFMSVDNAEDVKVYTIGNNFAHAETRKSPVVDGVVRRNAEGKEVRYITPLSEEEKEISRKVSETFGQTVCGFDLLRTGGRSYVIDVNGWSFVKGNDDYYEKCVEILRSLFLQAAKSRQMRVPTKSIENQWKLKAFLSVLRHGDRTPKQKAKFTFRSKPFMDLLNGTEEEVVLKNDQLRLVSRACDEAIEGSFEDATLLTQLRTILDLKSNLAGTKVQVKPSFNKKDKQLEKAQLIVKWGGEFTHGGKHQSKDLGENLRKDLRIINKALLDDIKIYSSSERRVIATAEILTQALLDTHDLPGSLITVNKEMLDDSNAAKEQMENVKSRLQAILNPNEPVKLPEHYLPEDIEDPESFLQEIIDLLAILRKILRQNIEEEEDVARIQERWCCSESPILFRERWEKLFKEFCDVERSAFEPSKISELYDSLKYDLLHNREFCEAIFASPEFGRQLLKQLYGKAKTLFDFIAPQEYGIETREKLEIGMLSSQALLKQLVDDLIAAKDCPHPCTRLYFTKESKVICLFNIVLLCGLPTKLKSGEVDELDYLTQITFELHERSSGSGSEDREYSLRLGFSPGAHDPNLIDLSLDGRHSLSVAPRRWISDHISLDEALHHLSPSTASQLSGSLRKRH
ncbi:histidine phosphatase superfamily-domain-containing protein [Zopfochytrium polystomum]|nr:histidine phosphatase superfamily-domain-containing protein [Zopfochytrium polystomum]